MEPWGTPDVTSGLGPEGGELNEQAAVDAVYPLVKK